MKRILTLVLSLVCCINCLIFPAAATDTNMQPETEEIISVSSTSRKSLYSPLSVFSGFWSVPGWHSAADDTLPAWPPRRASGYSSSGGLWA